jgi:hypothetical protein
MPPIADRSYNFAELEFEAIAFRRALGYSLTEPIIGLDFYDRIQQKYSVHLAGKNYGVGCSVVAELPAHREAQALFVPDSDDYEIVLTEQTYQGLENEDPRAKFTIVHEGAHIVLQAPLLQRLRLLDNNSLAALHAARPPAFFDTEWQAYCLASAFLMPSLAIEDLRRETDKGLMYVISRIQKRCQVSLEAAQKRWANFKYHHTLLLSPKTLGPRYIGLGPWPEESRRGDRSRPEFHRVEFAETNTRREEERLPDGLVPVENV